MLNLLFQGLVSPFLLPPRLKGMRTKKYDLFIIWNMAKAVQYMNTCCFGCLFFRNFRLYKTGLCCVINKHHTVENNSIRRMICLTSKPFFTGAGLTFSLMTSASEMAMVIFRDCKKILNV